MLDLLLKLAPLIISHLKEQQHPDPVAVVAEVAATLEKAKPAPVTAEEKRAAEEHDARWKRITELLAAMRR